MFPNIFVTLSTAAAQYSEKPCFTSVPRKALFALIGHWANSTVIGQLLNLCVGNITLLTITGF